MRVRRGWLALSVGLALCLPGVPHAQEPDRIWGSVRTHGGAVHEGFIRWDRNELSWADVLDGGKVPDVDLRDRVAEFFGETPTARGRSVEYLGVRISWDDDDAEGTNAAGVRFGHLAWLRPTSERTALLGLKSGQEVEFRGASTDLGTGMREFVVEPISGAPVELTWGEIERIDFEPAPAGARAGSARLHGTVEDRWGNRWTGFLAWDLDEALGSDVLDGDDEDGRRREIPFDRVAEIERRPAVGARVVLRGGEALVLDGSNDVGQGHRGVQISDPALGGIAVAWRDVRRVRFSESTPPAGAGYDDFDGGEELRGTVETDGGARLTGRVVWDADEARSWEMLDGSTRGVEVSVELSAVARIERLSSRRVRVSIRDGRVLELEGSDDVNRGNRGIVVALDDGGLEVVEWRRFVAVDFHRDR